MFRFSEVLDALDEIRSGDNFSEVDALDEFRSGDNFSEVDALDEFRSGDDYSEVDALDELRSGDDFSERDALDEIRSDNDFSEVDALDEIRSGDDFSEVDALDEIRSGDDFSQVLDALDEIRCGNDRSKSNSKPNFDPKWVNLVGKGKEERAINAIIEIRALWDYVTQEASQNYSNMYSKLTFPISEELKRECQRHKENFAVYDRKTKTWLVKSNAPKYEKCYDGKDFKEFKFVKSLMTGTRFLLVGKYTILSQEPNLLLKTRTAKSMLGMFTLPALKLIVGVPGCGKTTHIINNHSPASLVLTSCAEAAQDVRDRMALKQGGTLDQYRKSYRTIDSYLLHSRDRYGTVWVDEALMEHPGKLFLVCLFSRCRTMYMLGDPNQLGYINRVDGVELIYDKSSTFFTPSETLNISYRCPVDVMAILSSKYDGGAYSASKYTRSMSCRGFTGLECVPKSNKFKYLVFKQSEKREMIKAKYPDVSTIHEFQGKEADDVIIVRMSRVPGEWLYKSERHMLVGVSRHKVSLVYYTPVDDDLKKLIETPLMARDLNKVKKSTQ